MRRARHTRLAAAGAVLCGLSSTVGIVGLDVPGAAAATPTVVSHCVPDGARGFTRGTATGLPPNATLRLFAIIRGGDGQQFVTNGFPIINTGPDGVWDDPQTSPVSFTFPISTHAAIYADTNGNGTWDPNIDTTYFRGDAVHQTCVDVTMAPK